jgi:hypothetical protein
MANLFEITSKDIEQLNALQLTELLRLLLHLEAERYVIPISGIEVPLTIDVPDGGEDGRIQWEGALTKTDHIPSQFTLFQVKATAMGKGNCKKEVLTGGKLKPQVKEVFDANGCYILFNNRSCNKKQKQEKIKAIREAIQETKQKNAVKQKIDFYGSEDIAGWVNKYLVAVLKVCELVKLTVPAGSCTWEEWSRSDGMYQVQYVPTTTLEAQISQLRTVFQSHRNNPGQEARIMGFSGLGKTRMALEVFRPDKQNKAQDLLHRQVVYIDAANIPNDDVSSSVQNIRRQAFSGILVVDNCCITLQQELSRQIRHQDNKFSLLTIDYDFDTPSSQCKVIRLEPIEEGEKVISSILSQRYKGMPGEDVSRLETYAQGFPLIAMILQQDWIAGAENIGHLNDKQLTQRLLWGRQPVNQDAYEVLKVCALFERLGFEAELDEESKFVAQEFCRVEYKDFYKHIKTFIKNGIIEKRGRYISIKLIPLAIRLAAEWYQECPPDFKKTLFSAEVVPSNLHEAICARISKLHFLPEAQELTSELCGPQGPFWNAEGLLTDRGSELFRYLVEVNPKATVDALERVTFGFSQDGFLNIAGNIRRNLVWALEKLCFWEETFVQASRLMLEFAAAENESWGNNATHQFCQLFHIYLPGTKTPLQARLETVDEALHSESAEKKAIVIRALGAALETRWFNRMGGVESQGSRVSQADYQPQTSQEIYDYWKTCLTHLTQFAINVDEEQSKAAKDQLTNHIRGLIQNGFADELEKNFILISKSKWPFWPDAIEAFNHSLKYDIKDSNHALTERIEGWKRLFEPQDMPEKISMYVSKPSWDDWVPAKDGKIEDISATKAQEFAKELCKKPQELIKNLHYLLIDEQRKGFFFGESLAKHFPNRQELVSAILSELEAIPAPKRNVSVLGGILCYFKPSEPIWVKTIINEISENPSLVSFLPNIVHMLGADTETLHLLLALEKIGKISTDSLYLLSFGHSIVDLTIDDLTNFSIELASRSIQAAWISLQLVHRYCHGSEARWKACSTLLNKLLVSDKLRFDNNSMGNMASFTWQDTIKKLLEFEKLHDKTVLIILKRIFNFGDEESFLAIDSDVKAVIDLLLQKDYQLIWPLIGDILLNAEGMVRWRLVHLFGFRSNEKWSKSNGFLSLLSPEYLIQWCQEHHKGAEIIARIMPLFYLEENDNYSWQSLALALIQNFGEDPEVGRQICLNLSTGSFEGRMSKVNKRQLDALLELEKRVSIKTKVWLKKEIKFLESEIKRNEIQEAEEYF